MPPRDVLLFLKTEQVYTLTIFVETGSTNIIRVDHEDDSLIQDTNNPTPFFEIPIIARHFRDDTIIIEAIFKESFMELDWEYIQSQLIELNKTTLRRNENERLYIDGEGYNIDNQVIRFLMPARDFVLYLRAKDYRQELRLIREGTTDSFETVSISSGNGIPYFGKEFIDIQTGCVMEDANKWLISEFKKNEEVTITVHFEPKPEDNEKYYYEIDSEFLLAQLAKININPRIFIDSSDESKGYNESTQSFTFTMQEGGLDLVIKDTTLYRKLVIRPEPNQYRDEKTRRIMAIGTSVNNEIKEIKSDAGLSVDVIKNKTIDIFVKFQDVYQHLDKDYIFSQDAMVEIFEAGEFNGVATMPSSINVSNNASPDYKEYYQRIKLIMPDRDHILTLQWIERLFEIDVEYNARMVSFLNVEDICYFIQLGQKKNELFSFLIPNPRFPFSTYVSYLGENNRVLQNNIKLELLFNNIKIEFDPNESKFQESEGRYFLSEYIPSIDVNKNAFNFNVHKNNIRFFLSVSYTPGSYVLEQTRYIIAGSQILTKGIYNIWLRGGNGGKGASAACILSGKNEKGGEDGVRGQIISLLNVRIETDTLITYYLGDGGGNSSQDGNECTSGASGGGGGLSYFVTSIPFRGYTSLYFYANGGNGGGGGKHKKHIGVNNHSGAGQSSGGIWTPRGSTAPDNGTGANGHGGWRYNISRGQGGAGHRIPLGITPTNDFISTSLNGGYSTSPTSDGYIYIQFVSKI